MRTVKPSTLLIEAGEPLVQLVRDIEHADWCCGPIDPCPCGRSAYGDLIRKWEQAVRAASDSDSGDDG